MFSAPLLLFVLLACSHGASRATVAEAAEAAEPAEPASISVQLQAPHILQRPDFCGEACAAMAMQRLDLVVDQDAVFSLSGVDPAEGRGAWTREMKIALERLGFLPGPTWSPYDHHPTGDELDTELAAMVADLHAGIPSIVCMHYGDAPADSEHFRLVLGYDGEAEALVYHEPAEVDGAYRRMGREDFLRLWPLGGGDTWSLIRLRLEPGELNPPAVAGGHSPADFAQHVLALKTALPEGFHLVVQPPFVVIGDESPDQVRARAAGTVATAVRLLEKEYFVKQPAQIYDIWLFKDAPSYENHAWTLFGHQPDTPYGYANDELHVLVMNIGTGGGTLVHEIVHPYIEANFPFCPPWFNEGLASLYEHFTSRDGHPWGLTNWRLEGLLEAIAADDLPSFAQLTSLDVPGFYGEGSGVHYAQARYLCQYLQEKGLLQAYYRRFIHDQGQDPSGYETLKAVLKVEDMAAFQREWQGWAQGLAREG